MVLDIAWFKDGLEKCKDYIKTDGYGYFFIASTYFCMGTTRSFKQYSLCIGFQYLCTKQIVMYNIFYQTYRLTG